LEAKLQRELERRGILEAEYREAKLVAEMISDIEGNKKQLTDYVALSKARLLNLAAQWETVRLPAIKLYRELRAASALQLEDSKTKLEKIKELRAQMKLIIEDIHVKEERYKSMVEIYSSIPNKEMTRSNYTRRILEIVKNVKKQKIDINKILIDTRNLKKEINSVTDTLNRVFAVTDELIFADAKDPKKDPACKQAYKHMAAMDESFKTLVKDVEETGSTRNTVLNLEAKIDNIQSKISNLNLDRITEDLKEIKGENAKLLAKLKAQ